MASKRFPRATSFRVCMQKSFCCFFLYCACLLTLSVVNAADAPKKALIFGITGQDGTYLTEFLLNKNYEVHGVRRQSSTTNTKRFDQFYREMLSPRVNFFCILAIFPIQTTSLT